MELPCPVDVYSAAGEMLYGGTMAGRIFDTGKGIASLCRGPGGL